VSGRVLEKKLLCHLELQRKISGGGEGRGKRVALILLIKTVVQFAVESLHIKHGGEGRLVPLLAVVSGARKGRNYNCGVVRCRPLGKESPYSST